MRGRKGWAAVLLAGVAGVAAAGPVIWLTAVPASAYTAGVTINDKAKPDPTGAALFNQPVTSIHVNDRVIWTNKTQNKHTVTSDPGAFSFDSGVIAPGQTYEIRFTTAGTYTYKCTIHPSMVGRIEVTDPSAPTTTTAPAPPPPTTSTTAPAPPPTTAPPAPPTTAPPTTTTTPPPRPPAGAVPPPAPPVPKAASAPPPLASSSTTTLPSTTTTTVPPTTATSSPPAPAGGEAGAPPSSGPATSTTPPTTAPAQDSGAKAQSAAGPPARPAGHVDVTAVALVTALVAVGLFGLWTLIRVRPGAI